MTEPGPCHIPGCTARGHVQTNLRWFCMKHWADLCRGSWQT